MSKRKKFLLVLSIIATLGVVYFVIITFTDWRIPCYFHAITGLKCPGCGVSTMFVNLFHGKFLSAFYANPCLFILLPLWSIYLIVWFIFQPKLLKSGGKFEKAAVTTSVIVLIVFSVARNIYEKFL